MQFAQSGPHVYADFIPFAKMTPAQRAEHLVYAHGMGADYWANSTGVKSGDLPDDAAVVGWYTTGSYWTSLDGLIRLHEDDHDYLFDEGFETHTHTKRGLTMFTIEIDDRDFDTDNLRNVLEIPAARGYVAEITVDDASARVTFHGDVALQALTADSVIVGELEESPNGDLNIVATREFNLADIRRISFY